MQEQHEILKKRLNEIFKEVFDDETINITELTTAADIAEWDSLMHIALVVAVEKEFDLRLNAAEVGHLENVGAMIKVLAERATR